MDELGAKLITLNDRDNSVFDGIGHVLVQALLYSIKSLSVIGIIALIFVVGGIFIHNVRFFHDLILKFPIIPKEFIVGLIVRMATLTVIAGSKNVYNK